MLRGNLFRPLLNPAISATGSAATIAGNLIEGRGGFRFEGLMLSLQPGVPRVLPEGYE